MTVDHIVPQKHGGTDHEENLQLTLWSMQLNERNRHASRTYCTAQEVGCVKRVNYNYYKGRQYNSYDFSKFYTSRIFAP